MRLVIWWRVWYRGASDLVASDCQPQVRWMSSLFFHSVFFRIFCSMCADMQYLSFSGAFPTACFSADEQNTSRMIL